MLRKLEKEIINIDFRLNQWNKRFSVIAVNKQKRRIFEKRFDKIEKLLYTCDLEFLDYRKNLVKHLKSSETGLEDSEAKIRQQLRQVAKLEMEKGKDEDEMLDQTLKAIEIVNIADMANERENLESSYAFLEDRKNELDKLEQDLLREKAKRELKTAHRKGNPSRDFRDRGSDALLSPRSKN